MTILEKPCFSTDTALTGSACSEVSVGWTGGRDVL